MKLLQAKPNHSIQNGPVKNILASTIFLFIVCAISGCGSSPTAAEAKILAERRIAEYASLECLEPAEFGTPKISTEPGDKWVFDYVSNTTPRHLVRLTIKSASLIEISRMLEE